MLLHLSIYSSINYEKNITSYYYFKAKFEQVTTFEEMQIKTVYLYYVYYPFWIF